MKDRRTGRSRRRHKRNKQRLVVRFGTGDLVHSGYTQDVSESGVYLQCGTVLPPNTIVHLQIDSPQGPMVKTGLVRWCKNVPPALQRGLRGGMGIEFTEFIGKKVPPEASKVASGQALGPAVEPSGEPRRPVTPSGPPPEVSDEELARGTTQRRQVSTLGGNTFEIIRTEYRGAHYLRVFQLPRTEGSQEALLRQAFWSPDEAELAVKAFLKDQ